ncbi:unnamed protein product [Coffea canephora]|uniref:Leucine-rich repeat-containing N-terminal plant-type domain-containing protein n=1 Tax=Coffea canephora TaxID=49390 RepID=A0A068UZ97_COFCA|nr:unnamed protein product [Coffea canephora]
MLTNGRIKERDHIIIPLPGLEDYWTANTSVCDWIGVTCGIQHHRVTALNISFMGLTGSIPPHSGNLSFLVSLDLSVNNLPGEFVPFATPELIYPSFSKPETLELSYNPLKGKIPEVMGGQQNLRVLNLQYNQLTGSIPSSIFNISTLRGLYLTSNKLNGQLPSNFTACSVIQILSLSSNEFSGQIPREYGTLKKLEGLYLARNSLIAGFHLEARCLCLGCIF